MNPPAVAPARAALPALIGWFGFVMLVVYAIFVGGSGHGIYLVSLRTVSLILIAALMGAWFIGCLRTPDWRPATAIWPTLVIPVITLAFATLLSEWPRLGLEYVAWAVLLVALYLLLVRILSTRFARLRIGGLAALLALVLGLAYLGTVFAAWMEWWGLIGHLEVPPLRPLYAGLTLGSPGVVLAVQVLLTAAAIAGLGTGSRGRRVVLVAVCATTAGVVVATGGRAGWIGLLGAMILAVGARGLAAAWSGTLRTSLAQPRARLMTAAAAIVGLVAIITLSPVIGERLLGAGDGGRAQYFTTALRMFEESPLVGLGPGTWAVRRVAYTEPGELDWYIPHAHDVYLQAAAELGLVGLAAGLVALIPVGWLVLGALRGADAERSRWAWATLFVLAFVGITSLADFYMHLPAVLLVAAIPIAVLDATSERRIRAGPRIEQRAARWSRLARAILWLACAASIVLLARTESIAWTHDAAVRAANDADWQGARAAADSAVESDPEMNAYQITRGLVASGQRDWQVAAASYGRAATVDDMPMSWLGNAQALLAIDAPREDIIAALSGALRSGGQQPAVVYAVARLYDRLLEPQLADDAYAAVLTAAPSLAGDPWWTDDATISQRFDAILADAMRRAPALAWEMALMAGDPSRARELTEDADDPDLAALVVEAWQQDPEAIEWLYARADERPDDVPTLAWAKRIADVAGDARRSKRYGRLLAFGTIEGAVIPGDVVRMDPDGWLEDVPAGTLTWYAGEWLYRRRLPIDLVPPGLPRLVYRPATSTEPGPHA